MQSVEIGAPVVMSNRKDKLLFVRSQSAKLVIQHSMKSISDSYKIYTKSHTSVDLQFQSFEFILYLLYHELIIPIISKVNDLNIHLYIISFVK